MKKILKLTLVASAVLLLLLNLARFDPLKTKLFGYQDDKVQFLVKNITYINVQGYTVRSLDPKDSDSSHASVYMRQLVGTLFKFVSSGTVAPNLASRWEVLNGGKIWKVWLKQSLTCEDGTEINSTNYIKGLLLAFKNHSLSADTPVFSHLRGWKKFYEREAPTIAGLRSRENNLIEFEFEKVPAGIEAYLSMPYFGFYCLRNFDESGKWKNKNQIISSGPYRLLSFSPTGEVKIGLRKDWPNTDNPEAPLEISFKVSDDILVNKKPGTRVIVEASIGENDIVHPDWQVLKATASTSANIVLNSSRPLFSDKKFRRFFSKRLKDKIFDNKTKFKWSTLSPMFYPFVATANLPDPEEPISPMEALNENHIVFESFPVKNERAEFIERILRESSLELNLKFEAKDFSTNASSYSELNRRRTQQADAYFIGVDKGGAAEPWVVKMMFCSELGAQFPDPSGRICELTKKYEGRALSVDEYSRFGKEFENIVADDAVVVPVFHRGRAWFYSGDLDLTELTANTSVTDFLKIKVK